jgi:hypothetical protein
MATDPGTLIRSLHHTFVILCDKKMSGPTDDNPRNMILNNPRIVCNLFDCHRAIMIMIAVDIIYLNKTEINARLKRIVSRRKVVIYGIDFARKLLSGTNFTKAFLWKKIEGLSDNVMVLPAIITDHKWWSTAGKDTKVGPRGSIPALAQLIRYCYPSHDVMVIEDEL